MYCKRLQNQLQINQTSKLRIVGSSVNITDLIINDYTGGHNDPIWIKLDSATTFAWGIGSHTGTAVQSNIPLSTSATTLSNGIKVTFSATTGTVGDLFTFRAIGKPVAFEARAEDLEVRGLISMTTTLPVRGS